MQLCKSKFSNTSHARMYKKLLVQTAKLRRDYFIRYKDYAKKRAFVS